MRVQICERLELGGSERFGKDFRCLGQEFAELDAIQKHIQKSHLNGKVKRIPEKGNKRYGENLVSKWKKPKRRTLTWPIQPNDKVSSYLKGRPITHT